MDSLSSMKNIGNNFDSKIDIIKYSIGRAIEETCRLGKEMKLFYAPSHRGIKGNEKADKAANEAHQLQYITMLGTTVKEGKQIIEGKLKETWEETWHQEMRRQNAGTHLAYVRSGVEKWTWSSIPQNRKLETIMARLRIGHCDLRYHMNRFGMVWSPLCECGEMETVEHYLVTCTEHDRERRELKRKLDMIGVQVTMKNVLRWGGGYVLIKQKSIVTYLWEYIVSTAREVWQSRFLVNLLSLVEI